MDAPPIQGIGIPDNFFYEFRGIGTAAIPGIEPAGIVAFLALLQNVALAKIGNVRSIQRPGTVPNGENLHPGAPRLCGNQLRNAIAVYVQKGIAVACCITVPVQNICNICPIGIRSRKEAVGLTEFYQRQPAKLLLGVGIKNAFGVFLGDGLNVFCAAVQALVPLVCLCIMAKSNQECGAFCLCPEEIVLIDGGNIAQLCIYLKNIAVTQGKCPSKHHGGRLRFKVSVGGAILHGQNLCTLGNQFLNAVSIQIVQKIGQHLRAMGAF